MELLREQKLTGPNFIDWYRQLHLVLLTEDKENYLEHPIPVAPVAPPGQQVPPQALTAHAAWVKGQKEELKAMYSKQAKQELLQTVREFHTSKQEEVGQNLAVSLILVSLNKDFDSFMQNYNMHGMGKTKNQKNKPPKAAKGGHGKDKGKMGNASNNAPFASKPKTPPPPKKDNPVKDAICHQCGEVGHWRRNCPVYLAELMQKKKLSQGASTSGIFTIELYYFPSKSWIYDTGYGTHICITTQGLWGSKKMKPGALSLYVGDGYRAAVEATGTYHLELPSGLVIVLNNFHYAPTITRGVISVSRLFDGFINRFDDNNVISVSKNNLVYFMAVPRDGIYEIDTSCSDTNDSFMYAITNKRAKINLDSSLLWHCRLGHISKKRIENLQHDGLLNSINIQSLGKCVSCMSEKMAKKIYSHQVERAKDLLGLIHTDLCGPFKIVSRQGASYFVTFTDDFSRYGYVYLLKHKHEVFETFKVFQKEVENQLGKTIKSLRFDRGDLKASGSVEDLELNQEEDTILLKWNKQFNDEIKKFGFTQNPDEPCVYLKASGSYIAILNLYVNDILLMGNNISMLQDVKSYLGRSFVMKDLGEAAYILGIKIYRDRSKRTIPMQEKLKLSKSQGASTFTEKQHMQNIPYASAVGSIMYAVRCTRLDVAFAQNMTSRFQQNPGEEHWTAVKNILKYLRNTKDMFLVYGGNMERELRVSCYTDAGYLMDADNLKSQTGYVFILNGGAVDWKSTKQSIFATLSTYAKYIVAFDASNEVVWIRKFISGLGIVPTIEEPISMYYDNTGAIAIAKDDGVTKGARHFRAKVHYLRETIKLGDVKIEKIDTDENLADPFTKALAFLKHSELTRNIGLLLASSFIDNEIRAYKLQPRAMASYNGVAHTQWMPVSTRKFANAKGYKRTKNSDCI
uniref:CCHC-type domain-containing protein n=1 Tax=Tanacetum cinerariifolium TaxID=118510 RepID=A0A6L2NPI9_TANCI|nr:hypothetical protein [Tanacetum cinerariifolium]